MAFFTERYAHPHIDAFLKTVINSETNVVRFSALSSIDKHLRKYGFTLDWKKPYGPPGGWMLLYVTTAYRASGQGLVARIKTRGNPPNAKHRAGVPHMSVSWIEGSFLGYQNELRKYGGAGVPESPSAPDLTEEETTEWGDRTHPIFANRLSGAENLREDGAHA